MRALAQIASAVRAVLGKMIVRTVHVTRMVAGRIVSVPQTVVEYLASTAIPAAVEVAEGTAEAAAGVVRSAGQVAGAVVAAPFKLAKSLMGGGEAQQEAAADNRGEQAVAQQQERVDSSSDERDLLRAARTLVSARARGERLAPELTQRLPRELIDRLSALSDDECRLLASRPTAQLRAVLMGRGVPGVRSAQDIADAQAAEVAEALARTREARIEELMARRSPRASAEQPSRGMAPA